MLRLIVIRFNNFLGEEKQAEDYAKEIFQGKLPTELRKKDTITNSQVQEKEEKKKTGSEKEKNDDGKSIPQTNLTNMNATNLELKPQLHSCTFLQVQNIL